jgi:hypothetical protein
MSQATRAELASSQDVGRCIQLAQLIGELAKSMQACNNL